MSFFVRKNFKKFHLERYLWSERRDSNPRPRARKGHYLKCPFQSTYSTKLNYAPLLNSSRTSLFILVRDESSLLFGFNPNSRRPCFQRKPLRTFPCGCPHTFAFLAWLFVEFVFLVILERICSLDGFLEATEQAIEFLGFALQRYIRHYNHH